MFRMDLPFPAQVRVREERRLTFTSARALQRSAFGNQAVPLSGTLHHTTVYERAGEQIAVTLESVGFDQAGNLGPKTLSPPAPRRGDIRSPWPVWGQWEALRHHSLARHGLRRIGVRRSVSARACQFFRIVARSNFLVMHPIQGDWFEARQPFYLLISK